MTIREVAEALGLPRGASDPAEDREVSGVYVGDLLSDVMAHSRQGQIWITIQVHLNIVAVAVLKEHAAILLVNGRTPAEDTLRKAAEEHVPVLRSDLTAYDICCRLHALGVGGDS